MGREGGKGGGGVLARHISYHTHVSLHNQTETVNNNNELIWVMFRELKNILDIILAK